MNSELITSVWSYDDERIHGWGCILAHTVLATDRLVSRDSIHSPWHSITTPGTCCGLGNRSYIPGTDRIIFATTSRAAPGRIKPPIHWFPKALPGGTDTATGRAHKVTLALRPFLIYCASPSDSNHSQIIHQSLLEITSRYLTEKQEKLGEKWPLNFTYEVALSYL
jgi:hypothetical protein